MLPDQQASLVLDAMTLRGIGSYLDGARLQFRPLTILCGANGSGKSTWMKMLNLLQESIKQNLLPFGFSIADWAPDDIQVLNAFYHLASPESHLAVHSPEATSEFGPPGTIGLEFTITCPFSFRCDRSQDAELSGVPQTFLWQGDCPEGSKFRLRVAHPSYWSDACPTLELIDFIELQINDRFVVRMTGERDPLQRFEPGQPRPRRSKPYTLECSAAFLPGRDPEDAEIITIGTVTDLIGSRCDVASTDIPDDLPPQLLDRFDDRVRQLFRVALSGYFYIGAVRDPHTYIELDEDKLSEGAWSPDRQGEWGAWSPVVESRHVGAKGENSWILETIFSTNEMMPARPGEFKGYYLDGKRCLELLSDSSRSRTPKLARIWDLATLDRRSAVSALNPDSVPEPEATEAIANMLNSVLDREDLFSWECWGTPKKPVGSYGSEADLVEMLARAIRDGTLTKEEATEFEAVYHREVYTIENPKLVYYLNCRASWDHDDLTTFNRILVEDALGDGMTPFGTLESVPRFSAYVSRWTSDLSDVSLSRFGPDKDRNATGRSQWRLCFPAEARTLPGYAGYLIFPHPNNRDVTGELSMKRMLHACFGEVKTGSVAVALQPPRQLSSGFHQVFPMIVQLGLMQQGELVGIENPEVHLHPSMQLRVAKMLIDHANSGRHILAETHSDLLIRRVIRAILAEEIVQSRVQVYFVDLQKSTETRAITGPDAEWEVQFRHSTLNKLQVDERGRIANWPEGFMDDDVKESQRLLDIMYGGNKEGEDDDV
ncbi:MAG: AAA family ATPase [Planctomycetota bacterium]